MSQAHEDFFNKLKGAKPVQSRHPFIEHGKHRLAVEEYKMFGEPGSRTLSASFRVLASDKHDVGSLVAAIWQVEHAPRFKGDDCSQDRDRSVDFIAKLLGTDDLGKAAATVAQIVQREGTQPIKGMVIDCIAAYMAPKAKRDGTMGKPYTNLTWFNVTQSREQIKAQRDALESSPAVAPSTPPAAFEPPAQAVPASTPAPAAEPAGPSLLDTLGF